MAARLNPMNQTAVREKIRATQLINRLENYVLGKGTTEDGKEIDKESLKMEPAQVTAALGLLKKCVPDLTSGDLQVSGAIGQYQAVPTEQRDSDALASAAGAATRGDTPRLNS